MKIAVVDCSVSGHRETYYKQFAQTWAAMGHEVHLIAPDGTGINAFATFKEINFQSLLPLPIGQPIKKKVTVLHNALIRLRNLYTLRKQLKEIQPDLVYFPCLDDMLPTLSPIRLLNKLLPYHWSGLFVQSAQPKYKIGIPDIRPSLRSSFCLGIGVLNEYTIDVLKPFCRGISLFPDFADLSTPNKQHPLWQEVEKRAGDRKVISLLGSLNERKGTGLLLRTIPLLPQEEYFFLIAGKSSLTEEQTKAFEVLQTSRTNCLFAPERIPDEASFNALVSGSHLIFAAYRNFSGSSNMLTKSAAFNKPIIVSKGNCMGQRVENYHTGIAIKENDEEGCKAAIIQLCQENVLTSQGFAQYTADHRVEKLTDCFRQIIHQLP